jgi:single-strand DNA-binding protein
MSEATTEHRNEIFLVGRVTTPPAERALPSGDVVRTWRVTVDRDGEEPRFDVVDCTAWTARLQRSVTSWSKGDLVEIEGALRRRFWRTGAGTLASAYDVEVVRARRVSSGVKRPRKTG